MNKPQPIPLSDYQKVQPEYLPTKTNHSRLMRHDMKGGNVLEHTLTKERVCGWCYRPIEELGDMVEHLEGHGEPRI